MEQDQDFLEFTVKALVDNPARCWGGSGGNDMLPERMRPVGRGCPLCPLGAPWSTGAAGEMPGAPANSTRTGPL